ncbi:hypothetical protein ACWDKQ_18470 [Saccharopolyspora sp. NPDC000995]
MRAYFDGLVECARAEAEPRARHREKALDDWQILAPGPFSMRLDFLPELGSLPVPGLWLRGADDPLVGDREAGERLRQPLVGGGGHPRCRAPARRST